MRVIGVDEHVYRNTPYGDRCVTVILDLTPIRDRRGPSRLLDMVPGRSKQVFKTWLASQPNTWRENIEIVAMDGFTGFKSAAAEELPGARAVMDPFTSCTLPVMLSMSAADAFSKNFTIGAGVPPTPCTRPAGCYTPDPADSPRVSSIRSSTCSPAIATLPSKSHGAPTRTLPGAYRDPNKIRGKALMQAEMNTLTSTRVPRVLTELSTLGRTLKRRAGDILAYFDHPHTSNGPTEAINGRLEHLRGSALGFRNLTHYITRCLLETGGFRPQLHPQL